MVLAILESNASRPYGQRADLVARLSTLRREMGVLRQELMESNQLPASLNEEGYRLATQIDLLVNKFLRLLEC